MRDLGPGAPAARRGVADRVDAPGRREQPRDRPHPAGEQRERDEEAGDQPDGILEQVPERPGGAVAHERDREEKAHRADRDDGRDDREAERDGVLEGQVDAEHVAAEEQRRNHRVEAHRRHRDRHGEQNGREVHRGRDEQLERPVPALALHRRAGRRARRRPDAHHSCPERREDERLAVGSRPEHEERDRREEERPEDAEQPVEGRAHHHLQVEREPAAEHARDAERRARARRRRLALSHPPRPAPR